MSSDVPFVDPGTATLDFDQIMVESILLAKLIGLFVAIALVPLTVVFFFGGRSGLGLLFTLLAQFILATGSGVVLVYVVARGISLAGDGD
ncbi:hypothetical protein OB920_19940 [Halobacteria archaeon HArc-gm2]|nr:hypothetical protein [Halobacteria archaeon HArc-gm2]